MVGPRLINVAVQMMFDGGVSQLGPVVMKTGSDKIFADKVTHSSCRSKGRHFIASMESVAGLPVYMCYHGKKYRHQDFRCGINKKDKTSWKRYHKRTQQSTKQWAEIFPLTAQL